MAHKQEDNTLSLEQTRVLLQSSVGLCHFNVPEQLPEIMQNWLTGLYKGYRMPLPGFCLDLLGMVLDWTPNAASARNSIPGMLQYKEHVLLDFHFSSECSELKDIAQSFHTHPEVLPEFCGRFMELIALRMGKHLHTQLNPAYVREILKSSLDPEQGVDDVVSDSLWSEFLSPMEFIKAYQAVKPLVESQDLWELSELRLISDDALRYAVKTCRQNLGFCNSRVLEMRKRMRHELAHMFEQDKETGSFPIGGIAGIAARGRLESLVPSELIFMDELVMEHVDYFDVRYLENELLYWERDDQTTEDEVLEFNFLISNSSSWLGYRATHCRQPFFMYACLYWLMHELMNFCSGYRLHFVLHFPLAQGRETDYAPVMKAFFAPLVEQNLVRFQAVAALPDGEGLSRRMFVGKHMRRELSLFCEDSTLFLAPANGKVLQFREDEGFFDFLMQSFKELFRMVR